MIAITGSGEYLEPIKKYDQILLDKLTDKPKVITFPTAAGLESEDRLLYWENLAVRHFESLSVEHINFNARNREDLNSQEVLEAISNANFIYFSGGNPTHLYSSIKDTYFETALKEVLNRNGIVAGCSAGAMVFANKMIKGDGLNYIKNSIVIPHYGESFYSWINSTVKLLNRGKFKLICLEKNTYFCINNEKIEIVGENNIHIIYKDSHQTFSNGEMLNLNILDI
jgi:cyanophycinase